MIDGNRLTELMIDHDIGVSTARSYVVKKMDADYYFYEYTPLRPLEELQAEILGLETEIQQMLKGVMQ